MERYFKELLLELNLIVFNKVVSQAINSGNKVKQLESLCGDFDKEIEDLHYYKMI